MAGLFGGGRDKGAEDRQKLQDFIQTKAANDQRDKEYFAQQQRYQDERMAYQKQIDDERKKAYEDSKKSSGAVLGAPGASWSLAADSMPRNTFLQG